MPQLANALILIAALLTAHAALAAGPESPTVPEADAEACPDPSAAPPALDGAQLFAQHCAMCHKPAELARRLQNQPSLESGKAEMTGLLARHGRCDGAADAAIIDYLADGSFR